MKVSSGEVSGPAFVDIGGSPYADAINAPAGAGIISGYKEGDVWEFRPTRPLFRAQLAKMLVGSLGLPVSETMTLPPFTDLGTDPLDNPYPHEYVATAYNYGITKGTTDTTFGRRWRLLEPGSHYVIISCPGYRTVAFPAVAVGTTGWTELKVKLEADGAVR